MRGKEERDRPRFVGPLPDDRPPARGRRPSSDVAGGPPIKITPEAIEAAAAGDVALLVTLFAAEIQPDEAELAALQDAEDDGSRVSIPVDRRDAPYALRQPKGNYVGLPSDRIGKSHIRLIVGAYGSGGPRSLQNC